MSRWQCPICVYSIDSADLDDETVEHYIELHQSLYQHQRIAKESQIEWPEYSSGV